MLFSFSEYLNFFYQIDYFALRLARDAGLEYVEIQNLTEFYDDYR